MQLETYEDKKEAGDPEARSEVKLRFHFLFDMLKTESVKELHKFDWDINTNPIKRLYLGRDPIRMMEVVNNYYATVYIRHEVDEEGKSMSKSDPEE